MTSAQDCRWIFAYGSLMWRPGFEFEQRVPARVFGLHRRLSVYSNHYRGTHAEPGLVLGLDRGGSCAGLAYQVAHSRWAETLAYVREREMITAVYRESLKLVYFEGGQEPVTAITYVVDRKHKQCAPVLPLDDTLKLVKQGHGISGSCVDYVRNTLNHLRGMGVHDGNLEKLAAHLEI